MLSDHEAIETLLAKAKRLAQKETIPLADANGRVNAEEIYAPIHVPANDNSAMDGFACNSNDVKINTRIKLSQRIAAGDKPLPLAKGTAARIFTGANLPAGADCIVIQEDCDYDEQSVLLLTEPSPGRHVRYAGEDIEQGQIILAPGNSFGPAQVGLVASLGINMVCVYKKLRIALLTTGSELLEPGTSYKSGKRYNSNRYTLTAAIHQLNMEVTHHRIVADTLADTEAEILASCNDADIVISTGGVSVGDEDHVKTALENTGTMHLWKIAMKPGKPLAFGTINDTPFIGLPGNPVSALITFLVIARPFLLACQGLSSQPLIQHSVISSFEWNTQKRCEYLRVKLKQEDGQPIAHPYRSQDSGIQSSLHHSDGLVRIEKNSHIKIGDTLRYIPYSALFSATS